MLETCFFFCLFYHSHDNYNYVYKSKLHPKTVVRQFSVLCPERPPSHKEKQSDTQVEFLGLVYANVQCFSALLGSAKRSVLQALMQFVGQLVHNMASFCVLYCFDEL